MTAADDAPAAPWRFRPPHPIKVRESLDGYVARVAAEEGIPTTLEITGLGGVRWAHRPELGLSCSDGLSTVADCLGVDVTELEARSYPLSADGRRRRFFGAELDCGFLETRRRLFAPASLARSAHHRAVWALRPFPFCDVSWQFLTSRCPDPFCNAVQGWHHANGIDLCDQCGESLVLSTTPEVPVGLRPALTLILGLVHPDPARRAESKDRLPVSLRHLEPGDLLDLGCALAGVCDPTIRDPRSRRRPASGACPMSLVRAMAGAWHLLEGWPGTFERMAAEKLAARTGRFGDGNSGATLAFLDLAIRPGLTAPARDAVAHLARIMRDRAAKGLDPKRAARLTGFRVTEIVTLRRVGLLPTIAAFDADRARPLLCADAIRQLACALRSSVTIEAAAIRLGTTYHGIEQLMALGRLAVENHPAILRVDGEPRVVAASLDRLCDDLHRSAGDAAHDGWPRLLDIVRAIPGIKPTGVILDAAIAGRIRVICVGTGLRALERIRVHPDDLPRVLACRFDRADHPAFRFSPNMSKRDALDAVGLHLRHGTSTFKEWPTVTSRARTIPMTAVERLVTEIVGPGEIGARLGISAIAASCLLERHGVHRREDGGYDRPDAERFLGSMSEHIEAAPSPSRNGACPDDARQDIRHDPAAVGPDLPRSGDAQ